MAATRPTILQIIPELDTGGAELSTVEIAQAIVEAGGRALVLSQGGRLAEDLARVGGELMLFPAATKNPVRIARNGYEIARIIKRENVDLIHARSRAPAWSALIAARRTGIPFVTTYHGAYGEKGRLKKLYNSVMARSDLIIANSHYTAGLVASRYRTPSEKLRVIHRGVEAARFDPAAVAPERVTDLRKAWGIGPDVPVILQAARLTSWKGQDVVIEAVRRLADEERLGDAVIILAGDHQGRAAYRDALQAQIAAAGLTGRVRMVGHVSDMPAALATSLLAIVASVEPEAFGRTATEAQVMGCPVIATSIGAPPETVKGGPDVSPGQATGWLVPPGDVSALAQAIAEALGLSPDARREMGERARAHVIASFSLKAMKRLTLAVYDELLNKGMVDTWSETSRS
ncbi:glycosyltransferase family 4 protein [Filomicrobium sp.]|uniref:glycosyltransferase family 4 protein n=1 Tax=Filomicrobium sp. TaxID=2024831 RepID=UPI0025851059|nr:glycosyltransferase family 4 protein [Filomicrobium sp.]MCV0367988.1 glycosyltransferase family 4 protein [Filomicrobium sp.]